MKVQVGHMLPTWTIGLNFVVLELIRLDEPSNVPHTVHYHGGVLTGNRTDVLDIAFREDNEVRSFSGKRMSNRDAQIGLSMYER